MVSDLLVRALAFHRDPLRFKSLADPARPLPDSFGTMLVEANKALAPGRIQATAAALDTQPVELREAFVFFLRHSLLSPRADHYRVLGLSRNSKAESIKLHHSLLVRLFHPDRVPGEADRNSMLAARINSAYQTLYDPRTRRSYDMGLSPIAGTEQPRVWSPGAFKWSNPTTREIGLSRRLPALPYPLRRALLWMLAASMFVALVFLVLEDEQTMLQRQPERAPGSGSGATLPKASQLDPAPTAVAVEIEEKIIGDGGRRLETIISSRGADASRVPEDGATRLESVWRPYPIPRKELSPREAPAPSSARPEDDS